MFHSLRRLKLFNPYKAFYKIPYLIPPWGVNEINLFWRYLQGFREISVIGFEEEIRKKLKAGYQITFFDSARHALKMLLKTLSFPCRSEIIIPTLCCGTVASVIEECALVSSLADVGEDLCLTVDSIKKVMSPKTKGVILVHAGGAQAREYKKIIEFCNKEGLYLIDNAAQAWGNQIDEIWLGGRGNAGLISFGIGKSTFGMGGGMLISTLSKLRNMGESKIYNKTALMTFYLQYLKRSYTAPLFMYINKLRKGLGNHNLKVRDISYFDKLLQYSLFKKIDTLIEKRKMISLEIMSIFDKPSLFPQIDNLHIWTKLIIRLPEKSRNTFQKYLYLNKVETEDYCYPLHLRPYWKTRGKISLSGYPVAEQIYRELLVLPNSPRLTSSQLNYLYNVVKNFKERHL